MTTLLLAAILHTQATTLPNNDYTNAYKQALSSGRPLVVLLGAKWCPGCVQMKNSIMPQVAKAGGLVNVEFAYVDMDRQPKLAARLTRGGAIPQLIRYEKTKKGWRRGLLIGAHSPKRVTSFVDRKPANGQQPVQATAVLTSQAKSAGVEG